MLCSRRKSDPIQHVALKSPPWHPGKSDSTPHSSQSELGKEASVWSRTRWNWDVTTNFSKCRRHKPALNIWSLSGTKMNKDYETTPIQDTLSNSLPGHSSLHEDTSASYGGYATQTTLRADVTKCSLVDATIRTSRFNRSWGRQGWNKIAFGWPFNFGRVIIQRFFIRFALVICSRCAQVKLGSCHRQGRSYKRAFSSRKAIFQSVTNPSSQECEPVHSSHNEPWGRDDKQIQADLAKSTLIRTWGARETES